MIIFARQTGGGGGAVEGGWRGGGGGGAGVGGGASISGDFKLTFSFLHVNTVDTKDIAYFSTDQFCTAVQY